MDVGDIVLVRDHSWAVEYRPETGLSQERLFGLTFDIHWVVLATDGVFPTLPGWEHNTCQMPKRNDVLLAQQRHPDRLLFVRDTYCRSLPKPKVIVHVPEGIDVEVKAPDGVEVETIRV